MKADEKAHGPPPRAFSYGKGPQNAGKRGRLRNPRNRRKVLQLRLTQHQRRTTENRGVPGSSPGLAIHVDEALAALKASGTA
jgi:hypothetical protein